MRYNRRCLYIAQAFWARAFCSQQIHHWHVTTTQNHNDKDNDYDNTTDNGNKHDGYGHNINIVAVRDATGITENISTYG